MSYNHHRLLSSSQLVIILGLCSAFLVLNSNSLNPSPILYPLYTNKVSRNFLARSRGIYLGGVRESEANNRNSRLALWSSDCISRRHGFAQLRYEDPQCYFDLNRRNDSLKLEGFEKISCNKCGNGVEFNHVVSISI